MSMILEEMLMEDTDKAKQVRYSLMEISKALGPDFAVDLNVLLDRDTCLHCEEGQVSMRTPVCDVCGYEVDPKMVTWG